MHTLHIFSAGKEGAEQGALLGSNKCGLDIGGWVPAEIYIPEWDGFLDGVKKSRKMDHTGCVRRNIRDSEGVLLIGRDSQIARLVRRECLKQEKPLLAFLYKREYYYENHLLRLTRTLSRWIYNNDINFLCVTGSLESERPGIQGFTEALFITIAAEMRSRGTLPYKVRESVREEKRRLRKERRERLRKEREVNAKLKRRNKNRERS